MALFIALIPLPLVTVLAYVFIILIHRQSNVVQKLFAEVTTLVESTNQLVGTVGLEKLLPEIVKTIDQVGNEGEELIDHSFRQAVLLILIAMGAYIVARLIYNFLNQKLIRSQT